MVLTRRGSAQVEASLQTAARAGSSSSSSRSSRLTRRSLQQLDRTRTPPSQPPSSSPSTSDKVVIEPARMTTISATGASEDISFTDLQNPVDAWREFFDLEETTAEVEVVASSTLRGEAGAGAGADEGAEAMPIDEVVSWDSVFGGAVGDNQGTSGSALGSTAPHRQRRSIHSESSAASPLGDLDSLSAVSVTSTAPTSIAPSPAATIAEYKLDTSAGPSVLRPASVPSSIFIPPPPSTAAGEGYSSLMPRRPPSVQAPKTRMGRSALDVVKARSEAKVTYPGGAAAWLSLDESQRPFVNDALPLSAPVFSRRLASHAGTVKSIKAEHFGSNRAPRTKSEVKPKPILATRSSEEDIAPAVPVAETRKPRQRKPKVKPEGHTPRPPNAWILYRSAQIQILKSDPNVSKKPQSDISKLIGFMWRDESPEVRKHYEELAAIKKAEHHRMYPDYTFCPVRKPKAGEAPTAASSRASTPAAEQLKTRTGLPRRATAPVARAAPYSPRKRRPTDEERSTPDTVTVTLPSSLLGLDWGQPDPAAQVGLGSFVPHSSVDYQSNYAMERSLEALVASFGSTPSQAESVATSPCTPSYQHSLDCSPLHHYDIEGLPISPVDPASYAAWSAFESTTPSFFPESVPLAPMSAPAAYSSFNFGTVPSPFEQHQNPTPNGAVDYPFPLTSASTSAAATLGAFDTYSVPCTASSSSSNPYPTCSIPALSDVASPATTESSLASPGAAFVGEQLQPPFEMQWERTEGGCGTTTAELDFKRRLSTQWMAAQGEQVSWSAQPSIQEEFSR